MPRGAIAFSAGPAGEDQFSPPCPVPTQPQKRNPSVVSGLGTAPILRLVAEVCDHRVPGGGWHARQSSMGLTAQMAISADWTLVIARRELTEGLQDRLGLDPTVRVFSAADANRALAMAVQKGVPVVALDRHFAASPTGNAFMAELRTTRPEVDIRILSDEGGDVPLVLRCSIVDSGRVTVARHSEPLKGQVRRAPRYPVPPGSEALINGAPTSLVNVSATGAQLVSSDVLRPSQQVRVSLADGGDSIRLQAAVAWSAFERSQQTGQVCYRVGLEFADSKPELLRAYCREHNIEI